MHTGVVHIFVASLFLTHCLLTAPLVPGPMTGRPSIPPLCRGLSNGPFLSGYSSTCAIKRSWVQSPVGAICRTLGRIRDIIEKILFFGFFFALILSPLLGTPKNARVMSHFRPLVGPREGRGEATNSDFVPLCLETPKNAGIM